MTDNTLSFVKMHGLGNDFVVFDARSEPVHLTHAQIAAIAHRQTGVGCDQLIIIGPPVDQDADAWMSIFNADGSEVAACGNATRCVAWILMQQSGLDHTVIETKAGLLDAQRGDGLTVAVDMGPARLDWRDIPLADAVDTNHLNISAGPLTDPSAISMGNPHAVFWVEDAEAVDLTAWGPGLEHHAIFPERANIEVATVLAPDRIRMRVWERGTGITMACGTGACATLVAAARRGLTGRKATIVLDGGELLIEWLPDNHVLMTGPVATVFSGQLDKAWLP